MILEIYHCDGEIYRGWAFCPKWWAFCHKGWAFLPFCVNFIKSFCFYDIVYFMTKISVPQEFDVCFVMDQFQRVSTIGY